MTDERTVRFKVAVAEHDEGTTLILVMEEDVDITDVFFAFRAIASRFCAMLLQEGVKAEVVTQRMQEMIPAIVAEAAMEQDGIMPSPSGVN